LVDRIGGDKVGRPYATIQSAGQSKDASANNSKLPEPQYYEGDGKINGPRDIEYLNAREQEKELTEKFFGYLNYFFEHYTKGDEGIFEYWEKVKNHYEKEASGGEKEKMTDDEIMRFNEELMAKINKREVQPLEDSEGEKVEGSSKVSVTANVSMQEVGLPTKSGDDSKLSEPNWATPEYISMEEHEIKMKNQIAAFLNDLHALNNTFDKTMLDLMIVFWGEKLK